MIQNYCIPSSIDVLAKSEMKGQHHHKRRKPILSLGRRMGRKGDPRMHRAVQAKMADPNMSLFHALKAGGFKYLDDIDAKAVDEESVTLAQRKNQLSRRLRMTKGPEPDGSSKHGSDDEKSHRALDELVLAQQASFQSLLRQETGGSSDASVDSYAYPDQTTTGQHGEHHSKEGYSMFPDQTDNSESMGSSDRTSQQDQKMGPVYGKSNSISMFSDPFGANEPTPPPSRNASEVPCEQATNEPTRPPSRKASEASFVSPPSPLYGLGTRSFNESATGTPLCSEFGLRSLHRTAQSMGLTLDQLALVLSSTENLPTLLGIQNHKPEEQT